MIDDIYNFLKIDEQIGTAGQPTIEQFADIAAEGYEIVINLALPTSDGAIPNEGEIVSTHGMIFVHMPVDFESPTAEDFELFNGLMNTFADKKVFVHCAMNMRVSAFVFAYRVRKRKAPRDIALADLTTIWQPNAIWQKWIDAQLSN